MNVGVTRLERGAEALQNLAEQGVNVTIDGVQLRPESEVTEELQGGIEAVLEEVHTEESKDQKATNRVCLGVIGGLWNRLMDADENVRGERMTLHEVGRRVSRFLLYGGMAFGMDFLAGHDLIQIPFVKSVLDVFGLPTELATDIGIAGVVDRFYRRQLTEQAGREVRDDATERWTSIRGGDDLATRVETLREVSNIPDEVLRSQRLAEALGIEGDSANALDREMVNELLKIQNPDNNVLSAHIAQNIERWRHMNDDDLRRNGDFVLDEMRVNGDLDRHIWRASTSATSLGITLFGGIAKIVLPTGVDLPLGILDSLNNPVPIELLTQVIESVPFMGAHLEKLRRKVDQAAVPFVENLTDFFVKDAKKNKKTASSSSNASVHSRASGTSYTPPQPQMRGPFKKLRRRIRNFKQGVHNTWDTLQGLSGVIATS